jgi:hypothetical protein
MLEKWAYLNIGSFLMNLRIKTFFFHFANFIGYIDMKIQNKT